MTHILTPTDQKAADCKPVMFVMRLLFLLLMMVGMNVLNHAKQLRDSGRVSESIAYFDRVIDSDPENADARHGRAVALLAAGDYERGWTEYEWRFRSTGKTPPIDKPIWDGKSRGTVLIHCEGGIGDSFHFCRYASQVAQRAGNVVWGIQTELGSLFGKYPQKFPTTTHFDTDCDYQAFAMSLPLLLDLPNPSDSPRPPYLEVGVPRSKIPAAKISVGIHWQGNPKYRLDSQRSIPLKNFAQLADIPGVLLASLQKNYGCEQIKGCGFPVATSRNLDISGAFMNTVDVLKTLDCVITSDSAVAHLAGAMNLPVWLALSTSPDWRWGLNGESTPWYPSMRLFRQKTPGDWGGVFARIASELKALMEQ